MRVNLKLTRVGMNMEEATITKWHKQAGEPFVKGEIIYELETEKVTQEIEATADGTMLEVCVAEGDNALVGEVLCILDVEI